MEQGFCQLMCLKYSEMLIHIQYPVLRLKRPNISYTETMFDLGDAIQKLVDDDHSDSKQSYKYMNEVLAKSIFLFLESNHGFTLENFCVNCGKDIVGVNLFQWHVRLVVNATLDLQTSSMKGLDLQQHIDSLNKDGSLIIIESEDCMCYGLFKPEYVCYEVKPKYVLVRFENGMNDTATSTRKACPTSIELPSGESIPMYSLRFVADLPSTESLPCRPNEGLVTIGSMRKWLPTAANVLQIFTRLTAG